MTYVKNLCYTNKDMEEIDIVRKYFSADKFVMGAGIEIVEVRKERAVVSAEIGERHLNATGTVQGGMLYTIADFAFAVHANYLHPVTVTQNVTITYVSACRGGRITATATEAHVSGRNTVCDVSVTDENDNVLCLCRFNGFIKPDDRSKYFG